MDLEQIQATWSQLSSELEQQKKLTKQIILQMTQERYSNKFNTISTYETIGAIICLVVGIYILGNIAKLDTWYLLACGIFTVAFLFGMPIMVLSALHRIKNMDILEHSYKDTLVRYEKAKKNLLMLQQFGIYASFILMFSTAAVFSKIWSNEDFFMIERDGWIYGSIAVAVIFVIFFARWGYKCYKSVTSSAENILNELE
ncbi:MAG: hypothetical protein ACR2MT_11595 [Aurantibacter sp.]